MRGGLEGGDERCTWMDMAFWHVFHKCCLGGTEYDRSAGGGSKEGLGLKTSRVVIRHCCRRGG